MNQELEEKAVRKLFHEMRQGDERRAPSFASVEAAALARLGNARQPRRVVRVAIATAMLVMLVGAALVFYRQGVNQPAAPELSSSQPVIPQPLGVTPVDPPRTPGFLIKAGPLKARRQRARTRVRQSSLAISRWRSPTDFLLKGSDEQLLKSVPRLNDSIIEIKSFIPNERN